MEQSAPFETVTQLEVAERQLSVAIRLFFERRDRIAIHALQRPPWKSYGN
jgi:hypothetical protein